MNLRWPRYLAPALATHSTRVSALLFIAALVCACTETPTPHGRADVSVDLNIKHQIIDGFGTTASPAHGSEPWFQELYYRDLQASILRIDLTPTFRAPYSDYGYNSPWFHGSPALPGPEGNNTRTYRDASDYVRSYAGRSAQIAVMGPDIERNIALFDYDTAEVKARGALAQRGERERAKLSGFKLIGSVWSPAPWLKQTSGARVSETSQVGPKAGTPFPFIWNGNFAGGKLDTSGKPVALFDDSSLGGQGPTSALTQFARGLAAYILGFQRVYQTRFEVISIQNELGFETYYHSCAYPRAEEYIAALKAVREELDRHPELRHIRIMGPEDLLGETYSLWTLGEGKNTVTKNLGYLARVFENPDTSKLIDVASIHGYAPDGVSAQGEDPTLWKLWAYGWNKSPAPGMPVSAPGFRSFLKQSYMTETSGEAHTWLDDKPFPTDAAFGLALKIHQALTAGEQNAWLYWQLTWNREADANSLTNEALGARGPKYVAAKHYFRFIRPGARRVHARVSGSKALHASAYEHADNGTLTVVILHAGKEDAQATLELPATYAHAPLDVYTSWEQHPMQASMRRADKGKVLLKVPAYSVSTLVSRKE